VVGVLVLVHADVAEALLVAGERAGVPGEEFVGADEKVIEVHRVGAFETGLQDTVDLRGLAVERGLGGALHLVGVDQGVLGRGDARADGLQGELLGVDVKVVHDRLDETLRVVVIVDGEVGRVADELGILAEHADAHGVEGADPHAARTTRQEMTEALAHLGGSLVREGDGQDLPRAHALVGTHARDAVREHARLAGTRAREHEERSRGTQDRLPLRGVEAIHVDRWHAACGLAPKERGL